MNEITRKATNALVAAVDFFSGALAEEARAGEEKQRYLDALAGQLKAGENALDDAERELARAKDEIETLRLRVSVLEAREKGVEDLRRERDDLLLKCKNLKEQVEKPGILASVPEQAKAFLEVVGAARDLRDYLMGLMDRSRFVKALYFERLDAALKNLDATGFKL